MLLIFEALCMMKINLPGSVLEEVNLKKKKKYSQEESSLFKNLLVPFKKRHFFTGGKLVTYNSLLLPDPMQLNLVCR